MEEEGERKAHLLGKTANTVLPRFTRFRGCKARDLKHADSTVAERTGTVLRTPTALVYYHSTTARQWWRHLTMGDDA